jgi:hypothetical protein
MQLTSLMKEIVMNDELELDMELDIAELGDAKQETKGMPTGLIAELGTERTYRAE